MLIIIWWLLVPLALGLKCTDMRYPYNMNRGHNGHSWTTFYYDLGSNYSLSGGSGTDSIFYINGGQSGAPFFMKRQMVSPYAFGYIKKIVDEENPTADHLTRIDKTQITSDRFFMLLSGVTPNKQYLMVIKLSDGTALYKYEINQGAASFYSNNHFLFTNNEANEPFLVVANSEAYLALKTADGSYFGLARFNGLNSQNGDSAWFQYVQCSNVSSSECYSETLAIGASSSQIMLAASIQDKTNDTTLASIHLFETSDGNRYWDFLINVGSSSLTGFYKPSQLKYISSSAYMIMHNTDTSANPVLLAKVDFTGTAEPTGHELFSMGGSSVQYTVKSVTFDASLILILVRDETTPQSKIFKVDLSTSQYAVLDIYANFEVNDVFYKQPTVDPEDFVYVGSF